MKSQAEKRKRTQERKDAARKDSTSIRFSENDKKIIRDKAAVKDMQFSEFVRLMAVHGDDGLSPAKKVFLQNFANEACEAVEESAPEKSKSIKRKAEEIWTW